MELCIEKICEKNHHRHHIVIVYYTCSYDIHVSWEDHSHKIGPSGMEIVKAERFVGLSIKAGCYAVA